MCVFFSSSFWCKTLEPFSMFEHVNRAAERYIISIPAEERNQQ